MHLVRFPRIAINHALLLYAYSASEEAIRFAAYDPNAPDAPATLSYDRATRTFTLPHNTYFRAAASTCTRSTTAPGTSAPSGPRGASLLRGSKPTRFGRDPAVILLLDSTE